MVSDKKLDFKIDYRNLKIFEEFNSRDPKFPIVLSSPHSGTLFPAEFLENVAISKDELRSSEDSFVSEIIMNASNAGIPLISMNIPRTFIDVNRDNVEFQLFALLEKCPIVVIKILAVLPTGLVTGIIFAECILIRPGNVLEYKDFRSRIKFPEFTDEFFHILQ